MDASNPMRTRIGRDDFFESLHAQEAGIVLSCSMIKNVR